MKRFCIEDQPIRFDLTGQYISKEIFHRTHRIASR